jgi:hypothetical protein
MIDRLCFKRYSGPRLTIRTQYNVSPQNACATNWAAQMEGRSLPVAVSFSRGDGNLDADSISVRASAIPPCIWRYVTGAMIIIPRCVPSCVP